MAQELPLLTFADADAFERWLEAQPEDAPGAWLRFGKKGAGLVTLSKSEAVDSALAFGWVDGQLGKVDAASFKTRFTPRRGKSLWSQVNRERVAALRAAGRMRPAGEARVAEAVADGRWDAAYAPASRMETPDDLAAALSAEPAAAALFAALDGANRYAVLHRVATAKTARGRAATVARLVAMLARGETIHPRRGAAA